MQQGEQGTQYHAFAAGPEGFPSMPRGVKHRVLGVWIQLRGCVVRGAWRGCEVRALCVEGLRTGNTPSPGQSRPIWAADSADAARRLYQHTAFSAFGRLLLVLRSNTGQHWPCGGEKPPLFPFVLRFEGAIRICGLIYVQALTCSCHLGPVFLRTQ